MNLNLIAILFSISTAFFACGEAKVAASAGKCQTLGTVVDFDGLDGCGYLIKLKDGELLNPVGYPEGFRFKNNQSVRFDFQVLHDMASTCMAESEMVQITCIEDVKGDEGPVDCSKISNPFAIAWMDKAIDRHNPVKILKFQMGGKWAFAYKAEPNLTFLYDCDGKLLCESKGDENDECHQQYLNFISKGKVIWQGEGVWD